jgi:hypothetical protein
VGVQSERSLPGKGVAESIPSVSAAMTTFSLLTFTTR